MSIIVRAATAPDQTAIIALARGERVKPIGLRWQNFIIAESANELIGMVQLRPQMDGCRELGTLVVRRDSRQQGVAAVLIDTLLHNQSGCIVMITSAAYAHHYRRWGFAQIDVGKAPTSVRRNYWMGCYGGKVVALFQRRPFNPLTILVRPPVITSEALVRASGT